MIAGRPRSAFVVFLSFLTALAASWPLPVQAGGNAGFHFSKTVSAAAITPVLTLTLAVDRTSAIPGDILTYSGAVSNTGDSWGMTGQWRAESHNNTTATVASWWDEVQFCLSGCGNGLNNHWTALAGATGVTPGYTPAEPPDLSTGLQLVAVGAAQPGVVYPTNGDGILGTSVDPGATATWSYTATIPLTPTQVALLSDPNQVQVVRNVAHLETLDRNTNAAQPWTDTALVSNGFQAAAGAGNATAVAVNLTEPGGALVKLDSTAVPGFASIAPGASVPYSTKFTVPVPAARGATESDSAYLARLGGLDGSTLTASATLTATGSSGPAIAPPPPAVSTIEHLPVLGIAKAGPATVDAGATETNPLTISNTGSAPAASLPVTDTVPGGATGAVSGVPATLAPGGTVHASAAFPVPTAQPDGPLTDTAGLSWTDANGNAYGPVSGSFTTHVNNLFVGAKLTLSPAQAGPNKPGTTQTLTAALIDRNGKPLSGQPIKFTVTGANPTSGNANTDANGFATFTYTGANAGNDVAQAVLTAPGANNLSSNTSNISWVLLLQPVAITPVTGNFFANSTGSCTFLPAPGTTPVFAQQFPDILFNPAPSQVPHNISSVNQSTRPFTDLTTDVNGNFNGAIVAQDQSGNQAGSGALGTFFTELTGSFVIQQAGDVTLTISHDDGYLLGVGGGATRVSGAYENAPSSNQAPFTGYPLVAAFNQGVPGPASEQDTIHFPAAGTYPFELDYTECGTAQLTLVLQLTTFNAQNSPLSVYVGYADGLRPAGSIFPFPWAGSPNVTFIGGGTFDSGALRFDNSGDAPITFDQVTVDVGNHAHYDIWPRSLVVPPHQILILAQTNGENFDSSDVNGTGCGQDSGIKPVVHVISGGLTTDFTDSQEVLNTRGFDTACLGNESTSWVRIGGGGTPINVPLPPAASLNLSPFSVPNALQGQNLTLTVSAMDGAGKAVSGIPVTLQVFGANRGNLNATTDSSGLARFNYTGISAGTDTVIATGFVSGLREVSNTGTVVWAPPAGGSANPPPDPNAPPAPTISPLSIADGTVVTKPITVSASVTAPAGQTIASWRVFYQALDPGPPVVIGSGSGAPPAPPAALATFDPTVLVNDGYSITVEATASGGGIQDVTSSVSVLGNLKLGRYTTTYQDLSVPVNGFEMQVRRTYDSIDKSSGDFGVGWRVSVANFRTSSSRILGAGGWTQYNSSCTFGLCFTAFKNAAPRFVTVSYPDGHTEVFDFTPTGGTNLFWGCTPNFTARGAGSPGGSASSLVPVDDTGCSYLGDGNLYGNSGLYDPHRFRLTTHDGSVVVLDTLQGLISEQDRNGNQLSIDSTGVHASNGQSIAYSRDGSGRITKITGPAGQSLSYTYSAAGDLATSTDARGGTDQYSYDATHDLLSVTGPGGTGPLQAVTYGPDGRVASITDAAGNTTTVNSSVPGQQQTFVDPTGLTTIATYDDFGDTVRQDQVANGVTLTTIATYDSNGRPLSRTDPAGHVWTGTYDAAGDLVGIGLPSGHTTAVSYDGNGSITGYTDALGHSSTFSYDTSGNLTSYANPLGAPDSFAYDAAGHVTGHTDALGRTTSFAYDSAGHLVTTTDPRGNLTRRTYDTNGNVLTRSDGLGATTTYAYDTNGNVTSVTDALGSSATFQYNSLDLLTSVTDRAGKITTYSYDAGSRLVAKTDPLGRTTSYAYDLASRLVSSTDPTGAVTSYGYDGFGRLSSQTDPLGRTTRYAYDRAGRLTSTTEPNGGVVTYAYDADGHLTGRTDAMGRTTTFAYDAVGHQTSTTDALGFTAATAFDAEGRPTSVTDPLGNVSSRAYDAAGELVSSTDPLGRVTNYSYDPAGNQSSATDPLGHTTTYAHDAGNRLTSVVDALGRTTSYAYDADGRATRLTLPTGATALSTYDPRGLLLSVTDPLGRVTGYGYDAAGQQVLMTDPLGHVTQYQYDAAGRQTGITDALGGKVQVAFDAAGQDTKVTNPTGSVIQRSYDSLGNVAAETNPAGGVTSNTYDLAGELIKTVDPRGLTVTSTYDADGRQVGQTTPGGNISTSFDRAGKRTSVTDSTGTANYTYDAASQVTSVTSSQGTLGYSHDAAGNRTSLVLPGGKTVNYTYDAANQLTSIKDWLGSTTSFAYDPNGSLASLTRPNGVVSTYLYDAAEQLTGLNHDKSGVAITHDLYTYDANGNRTGFKSSAGQETYAYDALNRLTHATYPNGDVAGYTYDAAGNRTSSSSNGTTTNATYNGAGELTSYGTTSYTYDAAGNLTSAGGSSYSYDYAGRLASATVGGATTTYAYNADGIRTSATGATTTPYLTDSAEGLSQLVDDGSTTYLGAAGTVNEQVSHAGTAAYPLADGLGSVRQLTDAAGAVVGSSSYDVFGAPRSQSGASSIFGFSGQQTDPTGLIDLRARYLDPSTGRFLSMDSVQPNAAGTQGFNSYTYAAGNPTTWTDPTGHEVAVEYATRVAISAAVGAILGAGLAAIFCRHDETYASCILRGALYGLVAGFVFGLFPAGFVGGAGGACVAGAASGAAAVGAAKLTGENPDLGSLALSAGAGCVTAGLAAKFLPKIIGKIRGPGDPATAPGDPAAGPGDPAADDPVGTGKPAGPGNGPEGSWGPAHPGGAPPGSRAALYQEQVTGHPSTEGYWVNGYEFDGYDAARNVLLDAKGLRYAYLLDPKNSSWSGTEADLVTRATNQVKAAGGTPIEWHVAEQAALDRMRTFLPPQIILIFEPPI